MKTPVSFEIHQVCRPKKVKDLLPKSFVENVGLNPDQFVLGKGHTEPSQPNEEPKRLQLREKHIPKAVFFDDYMENDTDERKGVHNSNNPGDTNQLQSYRITIGDQKTSAISLFNCSDKKNTGIIVRAGQYHRYAVLNEPLPPEDACKSAIQIIGLDPDFQLRDYLEGQANVAKTIAEILVSLQHIETVIISVESVSCFVRSILRVKVTNSRAERIDMLVSGLIEIFCVAIELYE